MLEELGWSLEDFQRGNRVLKIVTQSKDLPNAVKNTKGSTSTDTASASAKESHITSSNDKEKEARKISDWLWWIGGSSHSKSN